jgi:hypothetical protein
MRKGQIMGVNDTDQRVMYYLSIWVEYMRRPDSSLSYPRASCGMSSGGAHSFDDLAGQADNYAARTMEAIIDDLPIPQKLAVHHFNLGAVWRPNRFNLQDEYGNAIAGIGRAIVRKGLV